MKQCPKCKNEHKKLGLFCSRKCANSRQWNSEDKLKKSVAAKNSKKKKQAAEKLKNKPGRIQTAKEKKKRSKTLKKLYKENSFLRLKCSERRLGKKANEETKRKLSIKAKERNLGGHTSKLKLYYKKKNNEVVYLQSSYELKVAETLEQNNINWIRPKPLKWEDSKQIEHNYYADFYLTSYNVYLDTKNDYLLVKDEEKINTVRKQNNVKLLVLNKTQLNWNTIYLMI